MTAPVPFHLSSFIVHRSSFITLPNGANFRYRIADEMEGKEC
jgi:hypothetical protein